LVEEDGEVTAKLWGSSARLRVASFDGDGAWPGLEFRLPAEKSEREKEKRGSRVFFGGGDIL
jgi:hypothetical protein